MQPTSNDLPQSLNPPHSKPINTNAQVAPDQTKNYLTSCQFFPHPTSTFSGTFNVIAEFISSRITFASCSTADFGVSNTNSSCTCISSFVGLFSFLRRS